MRYINLHLHYIRIDDVAYPLETSPSPRVILGKTGWAQLECLKNWEHWPPANLGRGVPDSLDECLPTRVTVLNFIILDQVVSAYTYVCPQNLAALGISLWVGA